MKQLLLQILFCLLTISFLGDAGFFPFPEKQKIENSEDGDSEEEVVENCKKLFLISDDHALYAESSLDNQKLSSLDKSLLFQRAYAVEIRPPRA